MFELYLKFLLVSEKKISTNTERNEEVTAFNCGYFIFGLKVHISTCCRSQGPCP